MDSKDAKSRRDFIAGCAITVLGTAALPGCRLDGVAESQQTAGASAGRVVIPGRGGRPRVRKSWSSLSPAEKALYARAIKAMKALPATNPHSLAAQAKIHADHCAHGTWNFLPWHRPYLGYFEEAIRAVTRDDSFSLPYWDWTNEPRLPADFGNASGPYRDLVDPTREGDELDPSTVNQAVIDQVLTETVWEVVMGTARGGGNPEGTPHGSVHVAVGGFGGNMGDLSRAGLDPVFWLHHCNIDRLWEAWMVLNGTRNHPDTQAHAGWTRSSLAGFWDRSGQAARATTADALQTTNFGYTYDQLQRHSNGGGLGGGTRRVRALSDSSVRTVNSTGSGNVASFPVDNATASRIASLGGNSNADMALAGRDAARNGTAASGSSGRSSPLSSVSLVLRGRFANRSRIQVRSGVGGAVLARYDVFAHHVDAIHLSLTHNAAAIRAAGGKLEFAIEVNGRPASGIKAQLVLA